MIFLRRSLHAGVLMAFFGAAVAHGLAADTTVLDRILVVVNGQPITQSRVDLYRGFLEVTKGTGLGWPREIHDVLQLSPEAMLDIVVTDELLFDGANRENVLPVREQALDHRMAEFKASFSSGSAYDTFVRTYDLTPEFLREFFSRRLRVEGYIRLKQSIRPPAEETLRMYYANNRGDFGERPFEEVQEEIAQRLYSEALLRDFDPWTTKLRERASVLVPGRIITR